MKTVLMAHSKGGVGKSTLAGILLEAWEGTGLVGAVETDRQESFQRRIDRLKEERGFAQPDQPILQITDTRGELGARAHAADLIVIPVGPTEDELQVTVSFLESFGAEDRKRVALVPIRFHLAGRSLIRQHKEALDYIHAMVDQFELAAVLPWITYRPLVQEFSQVFPTNPFHAVPEAHQSNPSFERMLEEFREFANGVAFLLQLPELELSEAEAVA